MKSIHQKILLVEGDEDRRVIPELMEANNIAWEKKNLPVYIRSCDGYNNIADTDVILTELQASGLSALGIVIDADEDPVNRWQSIRNASLTAIPDLPLALPNEGLIHQTLDGIKFGIWMMPDNTLSGMLETFLAYILPDKNEEIWQFSIEATKTAKNIGAAFEEHHLDKANIYTWLAWQDPPGRQLHQAIQQRILNPRHPQAAKFISWFKILYDL